MTQCGRDEVKRGDGVNDAGCDEALGCIRTIGDKHFTASLWHARITGITTFALQGHYSVKQGLVGHKHCDVSEDNLLIKMAAKRCASGREHLWRREAGLRG